MKKILILFFVMLNCFMLKANDNKDITYKRLITSIAYVESKHDPSAVSANKTYVGYLQISKICVREANNILGYKKYTYDDRYDKDKSIEIFLVIQNHHNPKKDIALAIRLWNEGLIAKKVKRTTNTPYMNEVFRLYNTKFAHIEE